MYSKYGVDTITSTSARAQAQRRTRRHFPLRKEKKYFFFSSSFLAMKIKYHRYHKHLTGYITEYIVRLFNSDRYY